MAAMTQRRATTTTPATTATIAPSMAIQIASAGVTPEWVQLMPAGTWQARDGRGPFSLADPAAVVAATRAAIADAAGGLPIDYDHAAEAKEHGVRAPAAGWIADVEAREDGLWARVQWTETAAAAIAAREYRFVSPVFYSDKQGRITLVARAGLTNTPAFKMAAIAASEQPDEDLMTEEQMTALRAALGLTETDGADAIVAAATRQGQAAQAAAAELGKVRTALGADEAADLAQVATELKTAGAGDDETEVDKLQKQLASLQADRAREKAEAVVAGAIKEGKLAPAQRDWAIGYASRDPEGFSAFVAQAPAVLGRGAPEGSPPAQAAAADASARAVCAQLGISLDDYKATAASLQADAAQTGSA